VDVATVRVGWWPLAEGTPAGGDVLDDRRCPRPVGGAGIAVWRAEPVEPAVDLETSEISVAVEIVRRELQRALGQGAGPVDALVPEAQLLGEDLDPSGRHLAQRLEHQVEQLHVLDESGAEHAVAAGRRPRQHIGLDRFERWRSTSSPNMAWTIALNSVAFRPVNPSVGRGADATARRMSTASSPWGIDRSTSPSVRSGLAISLRPRSQRSHCRVP
jgi:hypothetical protein